MSWTSLPLFSGEDLVLQGQGADSNRGDWVLVSGAVVASRLLLADFTGVIRVLSLARCHVGTAALLFSYHLFSRTSHLVEGISSLNCAAVLGSDLEAPYLLRMLDMETSSPDIILEVSLARFVTGGTSIEVFAMAPDAQQIALGLSDGSVVLLTLLDFKGKHSSSSVSLSGWLLSPPQPYSISGLHFCQLPPTVSSSEVIQLQTSTLVTSTR